MITDELELLGIIPVITIEDENKAPKVADALLKGGINTAEITCRTANAIKAIKKIKESTPDMLIGAGTVLTTKQLDDAVDAGAEYIVTPGFNPKVVEHALNRGVTIIPGVNNPSAIEQALEMGIKTVKFFPAEASGGLKYIKAIAAPYSMMKFIPTGGISADNISDYICFPKIAACGASYIATKAMIEKEDYENITRLSADAVKKVQGFKFMHIGVSFNSKDEADKNVVDFTNMFPLPVETTPLSSFVSDYIEFVNDPNLNHIAIAVNNVERSIAFLKKKGITFDESTRKTDANGTFFIYLNKEIGGFKIHLKRK